MWLDQRRMAEKVEFSKGQSYVWSWLLVVAAAVSCGRAPLGLAPSDGGRGGAADGNARNGGNADSSIADIALVTDAASDVPASTDLGVSRKPIAAACANAAECASGFCADGVCCRSSCEGLCQTCSAPSSLGVCTFVQVGVSPRGTTDCPTSAPSSCGMDGTCDGKGGCRRYVNGTACGADFCLNDSEVTASTCDGTGSCIAGVNIVCSPYQCDPSVGTCFVSCTSNAQCSGGFTCNGGSCGTIPQMPCQDNTECASGFCSQGACCQRACNGPC